jgi:DNA-binding winged helix-turn-helix (wHTH) protein
MANVSQYSFGPFRFDAAGHVLYRGDKDLGLPPKAADTLLMLLTRAGTVVDKGALLESIWSGVVVGEGSLTRTISILRKALGGDSASRAYIATVSKRGYRFVAPLDTEHAGKPAAERVMLAVLPFESSNARSGYDFFSDGLTEEMIAQLSTLNAEKLGVIARTSSMMFKGSRKRVADIGRELGVQYVLEGTLRRARASPRS